MTSPLKLKVVLGSTRNGRQGDAVSSWVLRGAVDHGAFDVELLDLRTYRLPMFGESDSRSGAMDAFNAAIADGAAFVFVTPEYNHSVPAVLKNAIDSVFGALRNKPAGFVGYSAGLVGGARAVEHLAQIVIEAEMVPLRNAVLVGQAHQAFADGQPNDPVRDGALDILLDDLAWWGDALRRARSAGELPPASARRTRQVAA
ncbi:MAG: NAD(P)H-dependent oxidoreductase [Actinomycetota bacterium]|nr:NAD(P)H-dependent oxidoreductase [Actinomycetota bacterium]